MLNLHRIYKSIQLFLLMALTMTTAGCATGKNALYKIDFSGRKEFYCTEIAKGHADKTKGRTRYGNIYGTQPKDKYRAGEEVVLYFYMVATDTNYTFLLDGEYFRPDYQSGKGYILRFVMPDHDIKLECRHRNSMVREEAPQIERE